MSKDFRDIKIEKLPASQVKITGEINAEAFEKARKHAIEHAKAQTEVAGFRAGKAPESIVLKHVGEAKILQMAAEDAINHAYGHIIEDNNIRAIGMPAVSINKLAQGNPLGFTIVTSVMPEVRLDDYKAIAKKAKAGVPDTAETVEDKEIEAVIEDLRNHLAVPKEITKEDGTKEMMKELPEFNDEFVKKLGEFTDIADFRTKARTNILEHKKHEASEKRRGAIAEALIDAAKFDVPDVIVESELEQMIGQFRADIERNGFTFEEYLKQIKKTEEEIRTEWKASADRRARLELILKHIGRAEKIELSEEEVKRDVDQIVSHHKSADRFRARMYVENLQTNKKVFEILENA